MQILRSLLLLLSLTMAGSLFAAEEHPTLATGASAPDFSLLGIDGKTYTLASFKDAQVLVIVFMCNHCPTSQAYEGRVIQLTKDYASKGVQVVAINPNHPGSLRLDELGYSDVGDSYEDMKVRAKDAGFNFHNASWSNLKQNYSAYADLLAAGAADDTEAGNRYRSESVV